ncbi:hypothetical protein [Salinarimonas sp.]|uniref:hypothetical protein n=1 Tax=Salinarimonas sp. TaxID=2766526 RepID=UPI0032D94549
MICEQIRSALAPLASCEPTTSGARIATHCLYPSFDPVEIHVVGHGDGFLVHDDGGAYREAWLHGCDQPAIKRWLTIAADRFSLQVVDSTLVAEIASAEWLQSGILSVANGAAFAATMALDRRPVSERRLVERITEALASAFREVEIQREVPVVGQSGKTHRFDLALTGPRGETLLIDAVAPHPVSIASSYVAFSDTQRASAARRVHFAVFDRPLDEADALLMRQVAELVPVAGLADGARRVLHARAT